MHRRLRMFGIPLDLLSPDALVHTLCTAVREGRRMRVEGLNVAKLVDARSLPLLHEALEEAELVHVDGAGIALGLRWLGVAAPARRAGIDLMQDLCEQAVRLDAGIFLLGARPQVVAATARALQARWPVLRVCGVRDGYFASADEADVVREIAASGAAFLFIGMSSPRKEDFVRRHWMQLGVNVAMGVGGSFDVLSGVLPRAPRILQRCGMEWLFRLVLEPRRLAGRYLRTNLVFLMLLLGARVRGRRAGALADVDPHPPEAR